MKTLLLSFLFCFSIVHVQSQEVTNLYVSKQTGEMTQYQGSYSKSTDRYETGNMVVSATGPIAYNITPNTFSIGTNETKAWQGRVFPDLANAPAPGSSANATLSGDYIITFSRPMGVGTGGAVTSTYNCGGCYYHTTGPGVHEMMRQTGIRNLAFVVHSVNVTAPDNKITCPDKVFGLTSEGYPAGGTYKWTAGDNTTIVGNANEEAVNFKNNAVGDGSLNVTYTVNGVSYTKTVQLNCKAPSVTLNVAETLEVAIDQQVSITPTLNPTGTVFWSVSDGLQLTSGPYNFVAFVKALAQGPQFRTVTLKAVICNQAIVKTVVIKVNPCAVSASDVVVLKNVDGTITANGNMQGTYAWTVGPNVQIQGAANQQTITIKGTAVGDSWAEVTFTGQNGCTAKKKVKVEVLDKPRLTVNVAYAPMATMCKGERRILSAVAEPSGGSYSWTLGSDALKFYGPAGNQPTAVIEAAHGGASSATCSYTYANQTVSVTLNTTVKEYSKVVVTASNGAQELAAGTTVTYTAKAYDQNGQEAAPPAFHWKVVYIPIGQENNAGNWYSYDLQGTGTTQTYTWSFPQGNYPLVGNPPYKMSAWIEAAEYCTYRSGSVHIKVVKP